MKCPKCQKEIDNNQDFCGYCGNHINHAILEGKPTRHIISVIVYYLIIYFLISFIQLAIMGVYQHLTGNPIFDENNKMLPQAENFISIWNQIIVYFLLLISIGLILIKDIIYDFGRLSYQGKKVIKYALVGLLLIYAVNYLLNAINSFAGIAGSSENQSIIENLIRNCSDFELFLYCIVLVICAPLVEELIFRKSFFQILKRFNLSKTKKIIISGVLFGILHVLSAIITFIVNQNPIMEIVIELIYSLPYIGTGFVLSFIYAETDENVVTPLIAHMLNNAISCIAMFFLYM